MMSTASLVCCFVCFFSVCFAQCGTYTSSNGFVFDLNPLTTSVDYYGSEDYIPYTYYWNFCKNVALTCDNKSATVIQAYSSSCFINGYLPAVLSSHPDGEEKGVVVTYVNRIERCNSWNPANRTTNIILTCDHNTEYSLISITEPEQCLYQFLINTKHACPIGSSTSTSSSSSSGTPGVGKFLVPLWITAISSLVIILLLVIVIIVVIAGLSKAKGYMALSNGEVIEL